MEPGRSLRGYRSDPVRMGFRPGWSARETGRCGWILEIFGGSVILPGWMYTRKRKRGVRSGARIFALSSWKDGVATSREGEGWG